MACSTISGLREQIIANAASAYPAEVQRHIQLHNSTIIKPNEIFDVVVMPKHARDQGVPGFRALVVKLHTRALVRLVGSSLSATGATIEEALTGLLVALGEIAMHNMEQTAGKMLPSVQDDEDAAMNLEIASEDQLAILHRVEN